MVGDAGFIPSPAAASPARRSLGRAGGQRGAVGRVSKGGGGLPHRVRGELGGDACGGRRSARFNDGFSGAVRGSLQGTAELRRVHDGELGDGTLLSL